MRKKGSFHYGWAVLVAGTAAIFAALGLARFGYSMLLPSMQSGLNMNNSQAGLLATISLAGYLGLAIFGGALAAKFGIRIVATAGLFLAGAGMIGAGLAHSFITVAVWSGLTGIGSGAVNISIMGLWPSWFARSRRGLASGIAVSGSSVGLIFTGLLVPRLTSYYGNQAWHTGWLIFGFVALIIAIAALLVLRNSPADKGLRPIGTKEILSADNRKGSGVIQWKQVYFSSQVWFLGLVYIAFGFSYIVFMTFFIKYLTANHSYSQAGAGQLFMMMGWFSLVSGLIWGTISDLIGRKNTLIILYLIHSVAFTLFGIGNTSSYFIISAILYGITAWSIPAIMAATCGDLLGPELAPAGLGFITLFFGIGQAVGPVVAGAIADRAGSFSPVFLLASAVALVGAMGSALVIKRKTYPVDENVLQAD